MTKTLRSVAAILIVAFCIILTACVADDSRKPIVTVSILPQKYFLEKIVGDKYDVKCLLSSGANPESYEPAITHLVNVEDSEAYFCIGNIGFESAIIDKVRANNPDIKILNCSDGIDLMVGTHGHSHGDKACNHEIDPHTWSSVRNAKIIATNMYRAIVDMNPENKRYYTENYDGLIAELDSLDARISQILHLKKGMAFLVWHPSLSYFARDYNLRQITIGQEGKESSVNTLRHHIDHAREDGVKVFFFQKEFDTRQAQVVNEQIGAKMVTINPLNYEWDKEMLVIANAIASN